MTPLSRRHLLRQTFRGLGPLALAALAQGTASSAGPRHRPGAKRVIFLCMSGGPAHLDTFDFKPQTGTKPHPGSVVPFRRHGQSGLWVSDLLPETARHADKLCVLSGMHADTGIHAQSFLQLHTGDRLRERPSLGAWVSYGLGTESQDLPAFISLNTSKPQAHGSAFLPSVHAGTPIGINGEDMATATIPSIRGDHLSASAKRAQLDFLQSLNRDHQARSPADAPLDGLIDSLELAFRMQSRCPDLLDVSREPESVRERYGLGQPAEPVGTCRVTDFGRQCLLARRFAEAGVRFIELNHGSWDQHKNHRRDLAANCRATDRPIAALLEDLDQRGLLDDTLVVWGGEFGRPGLVPDSGKDETDHNANGFTFWLAGGGVKPGFVHGRTDDTGARAVDGKVHFRDLHATLLHLLGLPANGLTFRHAGRDHRLTGPEGGRVVTEILA
jgi:hypothetical protein